MDNTLCFAVLCKWATPKYKAREVELRADAHVLSIWMQHKAV